jgi:hypothetical protein
VWSNNLQQNISYPCHVKHFRRYYSIEGGEEHERAKPFNYNLLLEDPEFSSINAELISNRKWNMNSIQNLIGEIRDLIVQIDLELRR